MKKTYVGVMGIIFIIIGVLGAIGVLFTFDWDMYMELNRYASLNAEEIAFMTEQRNANIIAVGTTLIVNVGIGILFLALDDIINLLKKKTV